MPTFAAHVHLLDVRTGRASSTLVLPVTAPSLDVARAKARRDARLLKRVGTVVDSIDVYP